MIVDPGSAFLILLMVLGGAAIVGLAVFGFCFFLGGAFSADRSER